MIVELTTTGPSQTRRLGRCLGQRLERGAVVRLYGDLGSGKTCFVQGLARGLAVPEAYDITSPTYTLIHQYPGRLPLVHVDLYRLDGAGEADDIGLFEFFGSEAVVAVEWADRLPDADWPAESLCIHFTAPEDRARHIRLFGAGLELDNLIVGAVELWKA